MYIPRQFEETRTEVMHAFIRQQPLGALVLATPQGLNVDHLPFLVDAGVPPLGVLRAHVARANPVWQMAPTGEAVAIFQGPDGYITPSWYASKRATGKVVPTWNYVVVHAHGPVRFVDDPAWLRAHLEELVATHEAGRAPPWQIGDAPADYVDKLIGHIVGVELPITRLEGKWKVGQNRAAEDRQGMVDGLLAEGTPAAAALAALIGKIG
jgi:transcriptional regulator